MLFLVVIVCLVPYCCAGNANQYELETVVKSMQQLKQEMTRNFQMVWDEIKLLQTQENVDISFSAYMIGGHQTIPSGQNIPFLGVHLNDGGGFNSANSVFTCPVSGVYFITATLQTGYQDGTTQRTTGVLSLDTSVLAEISCRQDDSYSFNLCSNSVVIKCNINQTLRVLSIADNNQIVGTIDLKQSTFSGFLIRAGVIY